MPPPATYVGVPVPVPCFAETDLSTHVETVAPVEGIVRVPAGSFPSNQRTQPDTLSGLKYGVRKIGIPYFSSYQIKPRP